MMLNAVKEVKKNLKAKDDIDAMGDFWQEVENLKAFEEKKEGITFATHCNQIGTIGCC